MTTIEHNNILSPSYKPSLRLTPSVKLQHRGKIATSYAPLAKDQAQAIQDSISAEIMLRTIRATDQRQARSAKRK